jgi:hypothetical protein
LLPPLLVEPPLPVDPPDALEPPLPDSPLDVELQAAEIIPNTSTTTR